MKYTLAHLLVLSSHSEYFSNIFRNRTLLPNQTEVIVENITEDMLRKIVEYCYTGRLEVENDKDRVEELLNKARYFQIKFLEETCFKWLINHSLLWPLSVYRHNSLEEYSEELRGKLFVYICEKFMQLYKSEEFLKISADKLTKLIAEDNIRVKSEENVLDALLSWLNFNFNERQQYIGKLLPLIRFPFLPPKYIYSHLKEICRSSENMKLMLEALEWHNVPENRATLDWICTKERHFDSLIMIIGHGGSEDECFEVYDSILNKCVHYNIMPKGRPHFDEIAATVMDNELIVAGGYDKNMRVNTAYNLNLTTMTWSQLPLMLAARSSFKLIVLQNKIYAVGGVWTNTVECWDSITNVWKFVSGMSKGRSGHCVIELDIKLYALGGWSVSFSSDALSSMDEPNLDKWTTKASLNKTRCNFSVRILNDFSYAIGGDKIEYSVERYNAKTDKWILLHTIVMEFEHLKCVSLQNCFIGTANYNDSTKIVKHDPVTNKITTLHTQKYVRWANEVLTIPHIMLSNFQ